jgi:hypothetical protein
MSQFILRGRVRAPERDPEEITDPIEALKEGRLFDRSGNPIAFGVDFSNMSVNDIQDILDQHTERGNEYDGRTRV